MPRLLVIVRIIRQDFVKYLPLADIIQLFTHAKPKGDDLGDVPSVGNMCIPRNDIIALPMRGYPALIHKLFC